MTTTIGEYPPDLPLTELCLALRDVTASVAALDLDDATLWAAADSIVAQVIAEVYAVTAQLAGNPQNRPAVAVSPVVRVRELAVCQRRLAAHLDRLDQLNLKLGQVRPTARRSIERIDQLNKQLRALGSEGTHDETDQLPGQDGGTGDGRTRGSGLSGRDDLEERGRVNVMITRRLRRDSRRVQWLCLRVAFGVLDRLAPGLAGRWVARLWCTVPRTSGRSRDDRPIPGLGVVPSVRSTLMLSGGRRIAVERWGEGGGPIYLVHGWGGWRGQLGGFIGPILSRGFSVVAFDMPSHGESGPGVLGPRRSHGWEMMETLTAVVARHGRPHAIVGHSLGCAITAFAISEGFASGSTDRMAANALAPARLGFVAPTLGPLPHIRGVIELLGCSHRTEKAMLKRISALIHRPVTDYDTCALPSPMPPTLIVHDYRDKEVAHDQAVKLAASWPAADVHSTDGLGHRRILRDPDVIERITEFVTTGRTLAGFRAADGVPPSESPKRTAARTPRE